MLSVSVGDVHAQLEAVSASGRLPMDIVDELLQPAEHLRVKPGDIAD